MLFNGVGGVLLLGFFFMFVLVKKILCSVCDCGVIVSLLNVWVLVL